MDEYDLVDFINPNDATRDDWARLKSFPRTMKKLLFREVYSEGEYRCIKHGLIPHVMEDKWFIFLEEGWLYFYRSWTGFLIYKVRITKIVEGYKVSEAWVNRNPDQYLQADDVYDAELLRYLIDRLLLCKKVSFPAKPNASVPFLSFFSNVGWGRGNREHGSAARNEAQYES